MTNDNDLLLLASSRDNGTYRVYIDSSGKKTLTPQPRKYTAEYTAPYVCYHVSTNSGKIVKGLLADKNPKKVVFPNCSKVAGNNNREGAFESAFSGCTSLTSVSFPSLTTATGGKVYDGAFHGAFSGCTSLTSVSFPSLTTATGSRNDGAFYMAFYGCTSLRSISFPALKTVTASTDVSATFSDAFLNCFFSTVHFKKSLKGTAGLDYKTMGFHREDQVVFDLP